jgi:tRNA wybutosine-synthesizing protein 2
MSVRVEVSTVAEQFTAVVERSRMQVAISALRAEGVYDDDRTVYDCGAGTVAIPVTAPPAETTVLEVAVDERPSPPETLTGLLRERGWTAAELDRVPESWGVVGDIALVAVADCPRPADVGEALLALVGGVDTVFAGDSIAGTNREPSVELLAGDGDTETVHREHGTVYALDLAEVVFTPDAGVERARMGDLAAGERVLDTSAGVGQFTLPMARAGATVTAVERDPAVFAYLVENVVRNGVTDSVESYRADWRDVLAGLPAETSFDRVVVDHRGSHEHLADALGVLAPGGTVHVHTTVPGAAFPERPSRRVREAVATAGRTVDTLDVRQVDTDGDGVVYAVVDGTLG